MAAGGRVVGTLKVGRRAQPVAVHGGRYRNPDSRLIQNDGDAGIHDFAVAMVVVLVPWG